MTERTYTAEEYLRGHMVLIGLPDDAANWLMDLWRVTQLFDDAYDGDKISRESASAAIWSAMVTMPINPFYNQFAAVLQPVVALQVLKWQAANEVEELGQANETSYVWRAGFYDIILMCAHLCGIQRGADVLKMYGESFAEYMEGLTCLDR